MNPQELCALGAGLGGGEDRLVVPGALFGYGGWLYHNPDEVMERSGNCGTHRSLSQFLSSRRTGGVCQQRRKELTVDSTASLCSNSFEAAWWEGWRFMAGMSDGAGPGVGLVSAGSSSALASVKQWTNKRCGCCDWYEFQGRACSLPVP